jgi:hypothetical protein
MIGFMHKPVDSPPLPPNTSGMPNGETPPAIGRRKLRIRTLIIAVAALLLIAAGIFGVQRLQAPKFSITKVPSGVQLETRLPKQADLPKSWTYGGNSSSGRTNYPGLGQPIPLQQCSYIGVLNGVGLIANLHDFVSYASETDSQTAANGLYAGLPVGTLTISLAEFKPDNAAAAISTITTWVRQCPSWTESAFNITYRSSTAAAAGPGEQNIIIHAVPAKAHTTGYRTEVLVARRGNGLVIVTCTAQVGGTIPSLSAVAAPLLSKL